MDLNVALPTTPSELFEDNDMVFPVLMGRENLKILASPGSESSGVSSLDADEAKKLVNEQLPTSSSPTLSSSEPSSTVQTESESSDGGSDGDDEKPTEQMPENIDNVQLIETEENDHQKSIISTVSTITMSTLTDFDDQSSDTKSKNGEQDEINEAQIEQLVTADDAIVASIQDEYATVKAAADAAALAMAEEIRYKNLKIMYDGRNILDFSANVANESWNVQYAHLPEKNYQMYINNRSQYNRLASGYEGPENYALNKCIFCKCKFEYPVMNLDIPAKGDRSQRSNSHICSVNDLLNNTVSSLVTRDSPTQNFSALAQKLATSPMHAPTNNGAGQFMQLKNALLNANNANQSFAAYQNRNQFGNVNAANNQSIFNNAFYNNPLTASVNQMGANAINNHINSMFMNNGNANNNTNNVNNVNNTNTANAAAVTNFFQQNRQHLFNYGACRQNNINKSGINFNANNSHKPMPTYSHF